jgi:hypothetical protein
MITHLCTTFIVRHQKTATTECGKKVATAKIAVEADATCPECRAAAERSHAAVKALAAHAATTLGENHKAVVDARACHEKGPQYRSIQLW